MSENETQRNINLRKISDYEERIKGLRQENTALYMKEKISWANSVLGKYFHIKTSDGERIIKTSKVDEHGDVRGFELYVRTKDAKIDWISAHFDGISIGRGESNATEITEDAFKDILKEYLSTTTVTSILWRLKYES